MENSNESSDVCLFCCKTGRYISYCDNSIVGKFITFLKRFSGDYKPKQDDDLFDCKRVSCCKPCLVIVQGFCVEFHELKCLELRLEWKLEQLMDIMILAGKVPVRMLKLQQLFPKSNNYTTNANGKGSDSLHKLFNHRRKIIQRCDERLSKSEPRIHLNRIRHSFLDADDADHSTEPYGPFDEASRTEEIEKPKVANNNPLLQNEIGKPVKADQNDFELLDLKFKCKICCKIFPTKIESHMKKVHSLYPCSECGKTFQTKYFRDKHRLTHKDLSAIKWKCIPCGRIFLKRSQLESHNKTTKHDKARATVACPKCQKMFQSKAKLEWHVERLHDNPIFHCCSICKKSFKTTSSLEYHTKSSHRDPNSFEYKCEFCDKRFFMDDVLQIHIKCHHSDTQGTPKDKTVKNMPVESKLVAEIFKCQKCPKKIFPTKKNLADHIKACHSIFQCPECKQIYKTKYRRDKHAFAVHYKKSKNPRKELLAKLKMLREKCERKRTIPGKRLTGSQIRNMFNRNIDQLQTSSGKSTDSNYACTDESHSVTRDNFCEDDNDEVTGKIEPKPALLSSTSSGYKTNKIKLENQTIIEFEEEDTGFLSEDLTCGEMTWEN